MEGEFRDAPEAILWPSCSSDIPDDSPLFRIAYLDPSWASVEPGRLSERLDDLQRFWGQTRRQFRNALAFAVPAAGPWEIFEREAMGNSPALAQNPPEAGQLPAPRIELLRARLFEAYRTLHLASDGRGSWGATEFERVELNLSPHSGRPLPAEVMSRMEAFLAREISPEEFARIIGLGRTDRMGVLRALFPLGEAATWFFRFLNLPRFRDVEPIRCAVHDGVRERRFGLLRTPRLLRLEALPAELRGEVRIGADLAPEEIRFESQAYLVWAGALSGGSS